MKHSIIAAAVAATIMAGVTGCSSDDDPEEIIEDILNKDSVTLSDLDQHDVTYENAAGGAVHTDRYCLNGMLGDKVGKDGMWSVAANDLIVNNTTSGNAVTYTTTSGTLVKNTTYPATGGAMFKVTKIAETVGCL